MTDRSKLQELFDAALRDCSEQHPGSPHQAFPGAHFIPKPIEPLSRPFTPTVAAEPNTPVAPAAPATPMTPAADCNGRNPIKEMPVSHAPEIDPETSAEMARILDAKESAARRKRKINSLLTATLLLGGSAGGTAWFVQSPERIQTFHQAVSDIRTVGDVPAMVAKFQDSLDRISVRGKQVDQATAAMGVVSDGTEEDPFFDTEMKEMMGGDGKPVGERNRAVIERFAKEENGNGTALADDATSLPAGNNFE